MSAPTDCGLSLSAGRKVRNGSTCRIWVRLWRDGAWSVPEKGWSSFKNGDLLDAAERDGFEVLVTTDTNLKFQQQLASRRIAVVDLTTTSRPRIQRALAAVVTAVDGADAGSYHEVPFP